LRGDLSQQFLGRGLSAHSNSIARELAWPAAELIQNVENATDFMPNELRAAT
jgi:hypothetical protein